MAKHFFDIGANDGNTFDLFLNEHQEYYGWNVWSFEPSPKHMNSLLNKARQVSGKFNVIVCPFGLAGKTQCIPFYEMVNNTCSDSFIETGLFATKDPNPQYNIIGSCVSICDFMESYTSDGDEVVLKVDCEGSEYDIYENLLANPKYISRIKKIYNEWHPSWVDMDPVRRSRAEKILEGFRAYPVQFTDWSF